MWWRGNQNRGGGGRVAVGRPTASETCGSATISILSTATNLTGGNTFGATRTWVAADDCGNTNSCSQTIATVDTTRPTFTFCPANQTNECGVALDFGTPDRKSAG